MSGNKAGTKKSGETPQIGVEMTIMDQLQEAVKVADLRKKETLRLIKSGKEIIAKIAEAELYGSVVIREDVGDDPTCPIELTRLLISKGYDGDVIVVDVYERGQVEEKVEDYWVISGDHEIPRSWWIDVIKKIPDLLEDIKRREDQKLTETTEAANQAQKLARELKSN